MFPALAFSEGTVHLWILVSIVLGIWFAWNILAKQLRRYTVAEESLTIPDFLETRLGDKVRHAASRRCRPDNLFLHVLRELRSERRGEAIGDHLRTGAQPEQLHQPHLTR